MKKILQSFTYHISSLRNCSRNLNTQSLYRYSASHCNQCVKINCLEFKYIRSQYTNDVLYLGYVITIQL